MAERREDLGEPPYPGMYAKQGAGGLWYWANLQAADPAPGGKLAAGRTPPCWSCVHWWGQCLCDAFPQGIPPEIKMGYNDHTEPWPGTPNFPTDHGIQYEAIDDDADDATE